MIECVDVCWSQPQMCQCDLHPIEVLRMLVKIVTPVSPRKEPINDRSWYWTNRDLG